MRGVDVAPTGALALAEVRSPKKYDDSTLLARAAELTAPLPPMPIPNSGAPEKATEQVAAVAAGKADAGDHAHPKSRRDGGETPSAALSGDDIARLFGGLPFDAFNAARRPASNSSDRRGPQ